MRRRAAARKLAARAQRRPAPRTAARRGRDGSLPDVGEGGTMRLGPPVHTQGLRSIEQRPDVYQRVRIAGSI